MLSLTCLISSQHLLQVSSTRYGRRSSREDCVASKCPCLNYNQWLQICGPSVRATLPGKEQWMSSIGLFCRVLLCPPIRQPPFASQAVTKSLDTVDILDLKLFAHDWAILWVPEHIHQLLQDPLPIQFRSREVPYIQRALRGQQKSCKGFCTKQQRMYLLPGTQWRLKKRAVRLTSKAPITEILKMGRVEILREMDDSLDRDWENSTVEAAGVRIRVWNELQLLQTGKNLACATAKISIHTF